MRKIFIIAIMFLIIDLFAMQTAQAQCTLYVSNLGQTPTGSATIGSDAWIAQSFLTGTNSNGYMLNSIQLLMDAASGSPSGFNVSIYSSLSGEPYNNLGNLVGSDPSAGGIFTYTASDLELSPSTVFFTVLTAVTPVAQGAYGWSAVFGPTGGSNGWIINGDYYSSADGLSWQISRQNTFQLAINATAVPEPTTYALLGLGLACLSFWRRRQ